MNAEQLRDQLLEVLAGASEPMSTTQARLAANRVLPAPRPGPVVAEEVYRAVVILARRGVVRRRPDGPRRPLGADPQPCAAAVGGMRARR